MGMTDQEVVALSGAHTLGRARPERSGWGESAQGRGGGSKQASVVSHNLVAVIAAWRYCCRHLPAAQYLDRAEVCCDVLCVDVARRPG
jgi:hypothetical protein